VIYLFCLRDVSDSQGGPAVSDIDPLDPLQGKVPACSQVGSWDPGMAANIRTTTSTGRPGSVGIVLLAVRYGKRRAYRLDISSKRKDSAIRHKGSARRLD